MNSNPIVGSPTLKKRNSGYPEPNADIKNRKEARKSAFFLPQAEEINPDKLPPIMQPISALEMVAPWAKEPNPSPLIK